MITLREKKGEGRLLHILMGRARTGKSERVLQRIAALGDSSQQILLVPEHASHVAEMDLCRVCGDTASRHAEALTFKLLASRVLSICGGSADVTLDSGGKLLTLQRTLTELAPVLKVYKRPSQRAAFLESLLAVMEELQAYAVSPEQLSESVAQIEGESGDKLRDLSLIYGIYLSKLHAPGHDARDVLEKLEENLEVSGYIDNKDIFLDGFSYFTGRELRILRILLRRAKSVTVTLLGDTQDRELFSESLRVRERLYALARDAGIACEEEILPQGEVRGALDHIERCFFGAADEFTQPTDTVALYEAGSAYSECEWVASQILQLVRKQGYRYREITVTARDLDSYAGAIENVFARYGIPLYYAHRSDILKSPVLTLLLGALDALGGRRAGKLPAQRGFCVGFPVGLASEEHIERDAERIRDLRQQLRVRGAAALPAGDGLPGDKERLTKILLRHADLLAAAGDVFTQLIACHGCMSSCWRFLS